MDFETYRRDSLWAHPFRCVERIGAVDPAARSAVIDGAVYTYEPCPLTDVVRLLDRPLGTLPVGRRALPLAGAAQTARAFRLLLREQVVTDARVGLRSRCGPRAPEEAPTGSRTHPALRGLPRPQ